MFLNDAGDCQILWIKACVKMWFNPISRCKWSQSISWTRGWRRYSA